MISNFTIWVLGLLFGGGLVLGLFFEGTTLHATVKSNPETQPPPKSNPKTQATYTVKLDIKLIVSILGGSVLGFIFSLAYFRDNLFHIKLHYISSLEFWVTYWRRL